MGIYGFTFDRNEIPAKAKLVSVSDARNSMSDDTYGPRPMWVYETHIGVCLFEQEQNDYNDSDFFMTYWDEIKQEPVRVMFATTRVWSYPALGSHADATPDIIAKYEAWKKVKAEEYRIAKRKAEAAKKIELRNRIRSIAKENEVNYCRLLKLRKHSQFEGMIALFGKRIRNQFRLNMRKQLIKWLNENSQYPTPFSKKQLNWI